MTSRRRHMMALLDAYEPDAAPHRYAEHLLLRAEEGDFALPSSRGDPSIEALALFGLSDEEWRAAVRAARLEYALSSLSDGFPLVSLSYSAVDPDSGRLQIWHGQPLRPEVFERNLQVGVLARDLQALADALSLLPPDWSLVVEVRRGTS